MKKTKLISLFAFVLAMLLAVGSVPAFAAELDLDAVDDIVWNLDFSKMKNETDNLGSEEFTLTTQNVTLQDFEDQKVLGINGGAGAYFIEDTNNILKEFKNFYIEADMYFESFPSGENGGKTPHDYPMSFMTWITQGSGSPQYGSIRVDDEGYLCTAASAGKHLSETAKLPLGEWFNIRFIVNPSTKQCEVFVNHESVGNYGFSMAKINEINVSRVRFFDTRYNYSVYFKGLSVTSDSNYRIGFVEEPSAHYIGYQSTPIENGKFDFRLVAGLDTLDYNKTGFGVYRIYDNGGEMITEQEEIKTTTVYESINTGKGTAKVTATELGYSYLVALELKDIDVSNGNTVLVIRPWVEKNGVKCYGKPMTAMYGGESKNGLPVLSPLAEATEYTLAVSDDTYVGGKFQASSNQEPHGKDEIMDIKNSKNSFSSSYTRAAYFKFTINDAALEIIENAETIYFEFTGKNVPNAGADGIKAVFTGVGTDWDESMLTKDLVGTKAPDIDKICEAGYFASTNRVDVTDYVKTYADEGAIGIRLENKLSDTEMGNTTEYTLYTKEFQNGLYAPRLVIVPSTLRLNFEVNIAKLNNRGYEPWGYAEKLVDAWFDEGGDKDKLYAKEYGKPNLAHISNNKANGDYSVYNPIVNSTANQYVRTLDTLSGFTQTTTTEYDEYYGITNLGIKGKATGFFHVEEIGNRKYIIDPAGNPYFAVGVNTVNLGATTNQKEESLKKYGSEEGFYEDLTAELHDDFGINTITGSTEFGKYGMTYVTSPGCSISSYMKKYSLSTSKGGSSSFLYNNTMNVFDPDFVTFSYENARNTVPALKDEEFLLGYTTDNEIPGGDDILLRYLTIEYNEPINAFSYATAWTWLQRATGKENPSVEDVTAELESEFLGFVYNAYFKTLSAAIRTYDPNHMFIGTRANTPTKDKEGYLRAIGQYCDLMTVNLYGRQDYSTINTVLEKIYNYSGLPFLVSEFGMRAKDAVDMNGINLGNYSETACWLFDTQQQRANSYESYVLNLLESNNCVGWLLYRFRDNDQSIYGDMNDGTKFYIASTSNQGTISKFTNIDTGEVVDASSFEYYVYYQGESDASNLTHNKGIYDNHMEQYTEMRDSFFRISESLVDLIHFFEK